MRTRRAFATLTVMKCSLVILAVLASLAAASPAPAQSGLPGGRPPDAIDRAKASATRPYTTLPPPAPPAERYVPERRFFSPEFGREVVVPGHWERRISDQRVEVPPLLATDARTGATVLVPGGERPPVESRQGP